MEGVPSGVSHIILIEFLEFINGFIKDQDLYSPVDGGIGFV